MWIFSPMLSRHIFFCFSVINFLDHLFSYHPLHLPISYCVVATSNLQNMTTRGSNWPLHNRLEWVHRRTPDTCTVYKRHFVYSVDTLPHQWTPTRDYVSTWQTHLWRGDPLATVHPGAWLGGQSPTPPGYVTTWQLDWVDTPPSQRIM